PHIITGLCLRVAPIEKLAMSAIGPKHVCFWGQSGQDHFALRNVRFFFPMTLGPLLCMAGYVRLFHQFISTSVKQFAVSAATSSCTDQSLEASNNGGENT